MNTNIVYVTFKWENISKEKLYTALGEINLRGEILSFESTAFEKNSSGVEKAELQSSHMGYNFF
jgi:hypothetical protein